MNNKLSSPIHFQQELTDSCQMKCTHCYNFWRTDNYKNSKVDESKILSIADKIIDGDVFHVTLTGGEPLLVSTDTLDKLISKYYSANVDVSMNSNITLLNPQHIRLLKRYNVHILTSMASCNEDVFDFITQTNGSYNRFIDATKLLKDNNINFSTNMVVTKNNLSDVYNTGKLVAKLGASSFCATKICKSDSGMIPNYDSTILNSKEIESMFDQLLAVKEDFNMNIATLNPVPPCALDNPLKYLDLLERSCTAGSSSANVSSNGDVKACLHVDVSYGNILEQSLKDIWNTIPVWRDEFLKNNIACNDCSEKSACSGGCRGDGYVDNKSLFDIDPSMRRPLTEKLYIDKPLIDIDAIRIVDGLRVRPEEHGTILYKSMFSQTYINGFSYDLILKNYGKNLVRDKLVKDGIPKLYVDKLFNELVYKKIARRSDD
jgi:radical SAM protein with 4Fe4S-binding SPASM domain